MSATPKRLERRVTTRIRTPALIKVRVSGEGRHSELTTIIDNVSAGGFFVRLMRELVPGGRLFAVIKFAAGPGGGEVAAQLAVRGRVLRVEPLTAGVFGTAVRIENYRFL